MSDLMTTHEVADYLRIKERKVYDLVRDGRIPCTRVTGKWLFPRHLIDLWVAQGMDPEASSGRQRAPAPPVVVGSHDPLLDWCVRESACEMALLTGGSLDGIRRMAAGEAAVCGLHVLSPDHAGDVDDDAAYNVALIRQACAGLDAVLIEWARREQGLVLAPGNPLGIASLADLRDKRPRIIARQSEAGSQILLLHLLERAGIGRGDLEFLETPARSHTDLGLAILEGRADVGVAVAQMAHQFKLDFVPLRRERYDLLVDRRAYFERPLQRLLAFTHGDAFAERVSALRGYDTGHLGRVVLNL